MVPYTTRTQSTTFSVCDSSTSSTTGFVDSNDEEWVTFIVVHRDEEPIPLPKEKSYFDRTMKMRNTDGRLFKPMLWKPIRG